MMLLYSAFIFSGKSLSRSAGTRHSDNDNSTVR